MKPDLCRLCAKNKPSWWCIDNTDSRWFWIKNDQVKESVAGSMFPCCQRCRTQMERDLKRGRKVEWLEWGEESVS